MISLDIIVSIFISSPKLEENSVFGLQRRAKIPAIKKVLVGQLGWWGAPDPPARAAPLDPLLPIRPPLPPYIPDSHHGFAAVASHLRAYTNCVELYARTCIK